MKTAPVIEKFIMEYVRCEVEVIDCSTTMAEELGIDSLTFVRMVNDAEERFDITIDDEELIGIRTVGDFESLLKKKGVKENAD